MRGYERDALASVGIHEIQVVERIDDRMLRGMDPKVIEREVKSKMARSLAAFIMEKADVESVRDYDRMAVHYRMRTFIADDEAMTRLIQDRIRVRMMEPVEPRWMGLDMAGPVPQRPAPAPPKKEYIEAHISSVPAGEIPEKPTAEMLSVFDDAYSAALFNADDKVSPEERGIEAVLKLLRKV